MDRSVDGGMAPALQSCNHQSTGLVKVEGNKEEDIVPQEKVNGSAYAEDSMHEAPVGSSNTLDPVSNAAGDANCSKNDISETEYFPTTDGCILTGLKEVLPAVSMPAIHIGQGDSTVQDALSYNGWGDCKRPQSGGILQESSNISSVHITGKSANKKTFLVKTDGNKVTPEKNEDENQLNGKVHDIPQHNGDLVSRSPSPVLQSRIHAENLGSSIANTVPFSTTSSSHFTAISSPVGIACNKISPALTSSSTVEPCEAEDAVSKDSSDTEKLDRTMSSPSPVLEVGKAFGTHLQEPRTLDYTDLLSSDLSKINMSDKLANTLQELAASLKGTHMSINTDTTSQEVVSSQLHDTVNSDGQDTSGRSVKSLDFSVCQLPDIIAENSLKDQRLRVKTKERTVSNSIGILDHRLNALKSNIDALRCGCIKRHVVKEICAVAAHIPLSGKSLGWTNEQVCALESESKHTHKTDNYPDFWRKLFVNDGTRGKKLSESEVPATRKQRPSSKDLAKVAESDKITTKQEPGTERKLSGDLTWIDFDPVVQLTRVEDLKNQMDQKRDLSSKAQASTEILRKELKFVRTRCDSDMTESSSDEDITEPAMGRTQKSKMAWKHIVKSSTRPKLRKSFCKWVAERAEISRRWTWLQSRISSLEFNIRQQGDLYAEMRDTKGVVQLDVHSHSSESCEGTRHVHSELSTLVPVSTSPCNVNTLVDNVHHQTSRLFNNLSPLSAGSPSPIQPQLKSSQTKDSLNAAKDLLPGESAETCARVKQLRLRSFRKRKIVKITQTALASDKGLKPKTVPNDSSLMCVGQDSAHDGDCLADYTSLVLKAARHDHSYHAVISSIQDIPLSVSMQAVMKSRRKWCKKSSPHKHEQKSRKHKRRKKHKLQKDKRIPNHVRDTKRRKFSSHGSESGRKRPRVGSMDSDIDSPVVIGGFNSHQSSGSRATTPTSEITGQSQNYWKKKKTSEQAYDINNIVIPHGLNSARIEKLPYKEIQTPSWKMVELDLNVETSAEVSTTDGKNLDGASDGEEEDLSVAEFQRRHDNYEIIEKRKYMAFMEWSISRRGSSRGSRMGNIRGPSTPDPDSPSSLSYTPSPVSFMGDPFSSTMMTSTAPPAQSTATSATSPTAQSGVTTRRMSSDQNGTQPGTPPSHYQQQQTQRTADTSLSYSFSSPSLASWQDGFGLRRGSHESAAIVNRTHESAAIVNRTLSEGANTNKNDQPNTRIWESRSFPLSDEDFRLLEDVEYAKLKLNGDDGASFDGNVGRDWEDGNRRNLFCRQPSGEKFPGDASRSNSQEGLHMKSSAAKRRRTDSRASSLASVDDTARHSDGSTASASSVRRKRKPSSFRSRSSQHKLEHGRGKGPLRQMGLSRNSKHRYLNIRLSETDDSTSDSDTDSNSSDMESSTSFDDAGHVVDDYADPEWECPRPKEKR